MRKHHSIQLGNSLMVLGILVILFGIGTAILGNLASFSMPSLLYLSSVLAIFLGSIIWLAGAHLSGHDPVTDRYYLMRYDRSHRH